MSAAALFFFLFVSPLRNSSLCTSSMCRESLVGSQGGEFHIISPSPKFRHFFHTDPGCSVSVLPSLPLELGDQLSWFVRHRRRILGDGNLVLKWKALRIDLSYNGDETYFPPLFNQSFLQRCAFIVTSSKNTELLVSLTFRVAGALEQFPLYRLVCLLCVLINIIQFCMCHDVKRIVEYVLGYLGGLVG